MKDKRKIAELIYGILKEGDVRTYLPLISGELEEEKTDKLKITKTPVLNSIGQELGKLLEKEDWKFKKLMELWKVGKREEKLIVISAMGVISRKEYEYAKQFIIDILDDISDWEICDQLSLRVIVKLATQNPSEIFGLMAQWVTFENKWVRRLAVATIPPYIRAKSSESKTCLEFLNKVMEESDKDVRKAIGWALREVSKKDGEAVFEFLKKWARSEDKNTKWIVREGMKKLPEEQQKQLRTMIGV